MRLLLVTPFAPDATAAHGGGVYLAGLAQALAERAELGLVTLVEEGPATTAEILGPFRQVFRVPRPGRPGGRRRLLHQARTLWQWRTTPLVAQKHWSPAFPVALRQAVAAFRPDVAFVELAQMAQYLPFLQDLPTVLTDHEAGCPANTRTGLGTWGDRRDRRLWGSYVDRFYPRATWLQAVTAEDAASLQARLGRPVGVRPPSFPVPAVPVDPGQAPERCLFLGDYRHGPNPEAARWLAHEVLPILRQQRPGVELWLAGPHQEHLADLAGSPGLRLCGFVPDLAGLFRQVRLVLAPLFSGAGVRMKSVAALAHGLPVVTNLLGAQGSAVPSTARAVAEGAEALAAAALVWLTDRSAATAAGNAGHRWAQLHLHPGAIATAQIELAAALASGRMPPGPTAR